MFRFATLCLLVLASIEAACAQEDFFDDEPPEFMPGLMATYECGELSIVRVDPEVQFDWGIERVDERLPVGNSFRARWSGLLDVKEDGKFGFQAYLSGTVSVAIDGEEILKGQTTSVGWVSGRPVELEFGRHEIQVEYQSLAELGGSELGLFVVEFGAPV